MIKTIYDNIVSLSKTKEFTIKLENGTELEIVKWWREDDISNDYECDWEFQNKKQEEVFKNLTEEDQDEVKDYLADLE